MASSRRASLLVIAIAVSGALAACDSLIGLGNFSTVDAPDSSGSVGDDAGDASDATMDVIEAGSFEAGDEGDVTVVDSGPEAMTQPDASIDAPSTIPDLWPLWTMPNPDAAIAPDSSTLLPHTMAYDLGPDGGSPTALDTVTMLTWLRAPGAVTSLAQAESYCAGFPGFRVPTRIQLVTLLDFTQSPVTINTTAFPSVMGDQLCTSSRVYVDGGVSGNNPWTINFNTGLTATTAPCNEVLCVEGP